MGWTKPRRAPRKCEEPGCQQHAQARGLCPRHYQRFYIAWKKACIENGSYSEMGNPVVSERPKWEYENTEGEQSLIDADEERTRANESEVSEDENVGIHEEQPSNR